MTRDEFQALLDRAAAGWAGGDAAAVGDYFATDVEYSDPFLYRFDRRDDLLPFFEPPLESAGVTILGDDSRLPINRCYVRDPFGNRIELVDAADTGFSARLRPT